MDKKAIAELLAMKNAKLILALCTKEELAELVAMDMPFEVGDNYLSMQHLVLAQEALKEKEQHFLAVTPNMEETTEEERALIYAMLVRCRKVISCRDKLEDMLKYDDREGWYDYKQVYETKVLDVYKATWRDRMVYPYNIVDNIKKYNKDESYILRDLYNHLGQRTPGKINIDDDEMTRQLRKMFSDISVTMLKPEIVLVGEKLKDKTLLELAGFYKQSGCKIINL